MNEQQSVLKQVGIMALSAAVLIGIIYVIALAGGNGGSNDTNDAETVQLTTPVSDADWSIGKSDAKVTIVEYGDYQCPACGIYHPVVKEIVDEYKDDVRFVFRHYPLQQIHKNALAASLAAEAAGKQGKHWEMHDILFERQNEWSDKNNAKEIFTNYARQFNLNTDQFNQDMESSELRTKVLEQYQTGSASQVSSTPTFFVNGEKVLNPRGADGFRTLINERLGK